MIFILELKNVFTGNWYIFTTDKRFLSKLFDLVKKERGTDIVDKVEAVTGDVSLPDLGMSTKDREKIISEAEIIFHCAATIRFDEVLKKAVLLNVRGTKLMLELAKQCKKLLVSISPFNRFFII